MPVLLLACAGLSLQIAWAMWQPKSAAMARELPMPVASHAWNIASIGDPIPMSKAIMLWLQSFDNSGAVTIPFKNLNYDHVIAWLNVVLGLDARSDYPLLAASRLYAEVPDEARERRMLDFVYQKFLEDTNRRWRWLAQATIVAKHRLHDFPLALKFAQALADNTDVSAVPSWARQMHIFIREDMGEVESARILLGGLLESGSITDERELRFLSERLQSLQQRHSDASSDAK